MPEKKEVRNYLVDTLLDIDLYKKKFPNIDFIAITTSLFILNVPPEGEEQFKEFSKEIQSTYFPMLYGVNASGFIESNIAFFHKYPYGELRGNGVLIGIVDSGIDYMNPLFQYEDKTTRIAAIWDQTLEGDGIGTFKYGKVFFEEDINKALQSEDPYQIVPSTDKVGHGTFLASIAGGHDRIGDSGYIGGAPDAMFVIVKLRQAKQYLREYYLLEDGVVAYQDNDYLVGVYTLLEIAKMLKKPLSMCTGIGCNDGGHDGKTVVEKYLEEISSYEDTIVVLSAGNEANQGHHYVNRIRQGEWQTVEVNTSDNEKGIIINIWMNKPDIATVAITTPLGQKIDKIPIAIGKQQKFRIPLEPTEITVTYREIDMGTGDENIQIRLKNPTPGTWKFSLYGEKIVDGEYNIWIPREGFILDNTRFLKPDAYTTVATPATASGPIVVGAYNSSDKSIYAPSSRGATRSLRIKPDFVAPGVNVQGATLDQKFKMGSGTSVAAAITTAAGALLLEWAIYGENMPNMNTRVAKTVFIRGANRNPKETYPNNITGYGELNLKNSLMGG
ncbi:MAG: S8 family peptidase [Cellulosilyticaceae bacterium]